MSACLATVTRMRGIGRAARVRRLAVGALARDGVPLRRGEASASTPLAETIPPRPERRERLSPYTHALERAVPRESAARGTLLGRNAELVPLGFAPPRERAAGHHRPRSRSSVTPARCRPRRTRPNHRSARAARSQRRHGSEIVAPPTARAARPGGRAARGAG